MSYNRITFVIWIFSFLITDSASISKLETAFEWKKINFTLDSLKYFNELDLLKAVPYDFERTKDNRTFVTLVAKKNLPISLTTISEKYKKDGPLLTPYPDSTWFSNPHDCNYIIAAWSIKIDKCNRLWVLDTGRIEKLQVCNPKLLVFNLENDKLMNKYEIPREMFSKTLNRSVLVNPIIETEGSSCNVRTVYMADSEGYAMVTWDGEKFSRIEGPEFEAVKISTHFNISGTTFNFAGGIVPMDSNPTSETLFFAPLASHNLLTFNKTELKRMPDAGTKQSFHGEERILEVQPSSFRLSSDGQILFIGLVDNSIRCWRINKELAAQNIHTAIVDNEKLQFISSMKIYPKSWGNNETSEEVWILTNSLQKSIRKIRNFDEINYRILKISMNNLINGTHCE